MLLLISLAGAVGEQSYFEEFYWPEKTSVAMILFLEPTSICSYSSVCDEISFAESYSPSAKDISREDLIPSCWSWPKDSFSYAICC
jgi:hypothetical protein